MRAGRRSGELVEPKSAFGFDVAQSPSSSEMKPDLMARGTLSSSKEAKVRLE
jgi:hypothetical protein